MPDIQCYHAVRSKEPVKPYPEEFKIGIIFAGILHCKRLDDLNQRFAIFQQIPYMKFYSGQTVTVLDTEYKPAGNAIVCKYEETSHKYEVEFKYPDSDSTNNILLPEERLILPASYLSDDLA